MKSPVRVVIHGAAGRMGQRLVALAAADVSLTIAGAIESSQHPRLGDDAGTVAGIDPILTPLSAQFPSQADVVIDFSNPHGADHVIQEASRLGLPLVMATTGLHDTTKEALRKLATSVPVCWSPSMSAAVNLTLRLAEICARTLKDHSSGVDVEIMERHHRFKEDAPSGTALKFGDVIASQMGLEKASHGRQGFTGVRSRNEIGYHAIRVGDNPGEHTIVFGMLGETIELRVAASNRDCYADGALRAAKFLVGRAPGLYSMNDVLGLT